MIITHKHAVLVPESCAIFISYIAWSITIGITEKLSDWNLQLAAPNVCYNTFVLCLKQTRVTRSSNQSYLIFALIITNYGCLFVPRINMSTTSVILPYPDTEVFLVNIVNGAKFFFIPINNLGLIQAKGNRDIIS